TCAPCTSCTAGPARAACAPCAAGAACNTCTPCAPCASGPTVAAALPAAPPGAALAAAPPAALPRAVAAIDTNAAFPRGEPAPRRKSFVDITAAPCFGHAPDYAWVSGQVEHSRILGAWRLRYASVDETDRFAGSVTLVENAHVGYLRDGEYVRV